MLAVTMRAQHLVVSDSLATLGAELVQAKIALFQLDGQVTFLAFEAFVYYNALYSQSIP